ncbi:hypothetical protein [Streptomyces reniochalinae]|uniref:TPM domain-containing protein n=1 Tax=Streptomyces reniochalinae TaxID=2250578 RepID=A0A367E9S3_9ACTN|nr:hypothetical protein [Streptomyces reniochalinae]RCG14107.1 hypothetical protein DQ392_29860 [Streptomyces reniochalinae]
MRRVVLTVAALSLGALLGPAPSAATAATPAAAAGSAPAATTAAAGSAATAGRSVSTATAERSASAATAATRGSRAVKAPTGQEADGAARQAAWFARRLRADPVHVSDQIPFAHPRSAASRFAAQAARTGVPTYVLVVPFQTALDARELLGAVHRKVDRKGLYVVVDGTSGDQLEAAAYGVSVPAEDAARAAGWEMPSDATALDVFTRFVDVVRQSGARAAARASEAEERRLVDEKRPEPFYTTRGDRSVSSGVAGALAGGVPLLVLAVGCTVCRRHRGHGRGFLGYGVPLVCAIGAAVLVHSGAVAFAQGEKAVPSARPTAHDLQLRADRVAEGLRRAPVYQDPESPAALDGRHLTAVRERLSALEVPARLVVLPALADEDESGGDADLFLQRLHETLGEDGLYILAGGDGFDGFDVTVANYGVKLAAKELDDYGDWIRYGPEDSDEEPALGRRITALARHVEDVPQGPPGRPEDAGRVDEPADTSLPPVDSGAYRPAAGGAAGLVLAGWGALAARRRIREGTGLTASLPRIPAAWAVPEAGGRDAPARPRRRWLRRTAGRELNELAAAFAAAEGGLDKAARGHVWACLDAAVLLLDRQGDGRIDADADRGDLAAALALVRAGRAALGGSGRQAVRRRLCSVNPLHGTYEPAGRAAGCAACRAAAAGPDRARGLLLPGTDGAPVPYRESPGPLGLAATSEVRHLIDHVRERFHVSDVSG